MPLSRDVEEVIRKAAIEVMTRPLTADEVFAEVLRLVREADTAEKIEAVGRMIGEIKGLGQMMVDAWRSGQSSATEPDPDAPPPLSGGSACASVVVDGPLADLIAKSV